MIKSHHLSWAVAIFFAVIVAVVFHQIATDMTEQGIASGGPYDNAASYPRSIALIIVGLISAQLVIDFILRRSDKEHVEVTEISKLNRPALLLMIFGGYLFLLTILGYHLMTAPMIFAIIWLCGERQIKKMIVASIGMAFVSAYFFEKVLNVVLPGGYFGLNIAW